MSWQNRAQSATEFDQERQGGDPYTYIQWVNQGGSLDPRQELGGFFQPIDQAETLGYTVPGTMAQVHLRGGNTIEGVYADQLEIAVLAHRFGWKNGANGDFAVGKRPGPGWTGKTQFLALVRADGEIAPVKLTFSGWPGSFFKEALDAHKAAVADAAPGAPSWLFYGVYVADSTEMVGQKGAQSPVTRVAYAGEFDPDTAYIGDAAADMVESLADEVRQWADAWRDGNGNGDYANGGNGGNGDEPSAKATPPANGARKGTANGSAKAPRDPDAPASAAQWNLIRRLLGELGIEGKGKQNAALTKRGFDPDALNMGQASELIERLKAAQGA